MDERAIGWWMGTCERASREGRSDTRRITHVAAVMAVRWVSESSHVLQLVVAWVQGGVSGMMSALHMCVCVCVHGSQAQDGGTALMRAAQQGHNEIAQALIAGGADMNLQVC